MRDDIETLNTRLSKNIDAFIDSLQSPERYEEPKEQIYGCMDEMRETMERTKVELIFIEEEMTRLRKLIDIAQQVCLFRENVLQNKTPISVWLKKITGKN